MEKQILDVLLKVQKTQEEMLIDQRGMKQDITDIKEEQKTMKQDIVNMKKDIKEIKQEQAKTNKQIEEIKYQREIDSINIAKILEEQVRARKESNDRFEFIKQCFSKQNQEIIDLNYRVHLLETN